MKSLPLAFFTLLWVAASQVALAEGVLQAFFSPGEVLVPDKPYYSENGDYYAVHQTIDNNLVVHKTEGRKYVWGLNELTDSYSLMTKVEMGADGQLVGTDDNGSIVWKPLEAIVIYRMDTPAVEPVEMEPAEVVQTIPTTEELIPAGVYNIATISDVYTATRASPAEKRIGVVFNGTGLAVEEDWSFELIGPYVQPQRPDLRPVYTTGSLELRGQQICSEANLSSFYDMAGRSLLDISGACFSYSKGFEYRGVMFPHCITLTSEEKGAKVVLCPH
tara:strand:+ start:9626 stop:10450 length:825 start_codon:yes stop_codon:yes gene_type:complete